MGRDGTNQIVLVEWNKESHSMSETDKKARVTKLTEEDDIETYLTTFEQIMDAYEVPQS